MFQLPLRRALLCILLYPCVAHGQVISFGTVSDGFGNLGTVDVSAYTSLDFNSFLIDSKNANNGDVQSPGGSLSWLDLKAPSKARSEYDTGYKLLMQKNPQAAVTHLTNAIGIYPKFVAAHNALGSAELDLGQSDLAHDEFSQAVALDNTRPNSYLNLGCAELALKKYPEAEESLRKASSLAPLDPQLQLALAYGEFLNHDYSALIASARRAKDKKHREPAVIHFFAAGAWEAQGNLGEAQREMETLLQEDPKTPSADQYRKILDQLKAEQAWRKETALQPTHDNVSYALSISAPTPEEIARRAQQDMQRTTENKQIEDAEAAPDPTCAYCATMGAVESPGPSVTGSDPELPGDKSVGPIFRITVDEVGVFFAVTDHGKPVTDLTASDVQIRDDSRPPDAIFGFRGESQLPLRLGLVIDTSDSVNKRFSFEQAAATDFLQKAIVDKNDLAFVVAANNSVILAQDFTGDQDSISDAVKHLAPGGGTALWDAVSFAAGKLAEHPEDRPVARVLVVISDGEDNSSSTTLKQAIQSAQLGEVAVYTVSTSDESNQEKGALVGEHALKTLAELTGGTAFVPGSARFLNGSLADLQQIIRGRYLISYKPASFQPDGRYRTIQIEAQKDGRKLKVFARRGYYASSATPGSANP